MTTIDRPPLMTTEELLALPEDGVDRELVRGRLRERPMTRRNRRHSRTLVRLSYLLEAWLLTQPKPRGEVVGGEAGFRIRRNPDTTVGVDLAYIDAKLAATTPQDAFLIDGPPLLVVEVLSPSDSQEDILEKVRDYIEAGVKLVWVAEPVFRTVTVYRPDAQPQMYSGNQELSGEPHLPGFHTPVAEVFG